MKKLKLKYILAMVLTSALTMPILAQENVQKKKVFYDSKSNLVGITGEYRLLENDKHFYQVPVELPIIDTTNPQELCNSWNLQNVGRKVLDALFCFNGVSLSEDYLKQLAMQNVLKSDDERAAFGIIDKETILKEDYLPILMNNYIFINPSIEKKTAGDKARWMVFKVDIDKNVLEQVFNCWNNMERYKQIQVPIKYIASGKAKNASNFWDPNRSQNMPVEQYLKMKTRRKIARKVEAFAIRGQVVSRHPFMMDIGEKTGIKNRDRMIIYRAKQKKDGEKYSSRVSTTRACAVSDSTAHLYTFAGGQASFKKGDVAVYDISHNTSVAITGGYQDHTYNLNLTFDKRLHLSPGGVSTYFIGMIGGGVYEHPDRLYATNNGSLVNSPIIVNAGLGYGIGYEFAHSMEIEPYFIAQWEGLFFTSKEKSKLSETDDKGRPLTYSSSVIANSVRIPLGARFNLNICYPVQLVLGAEYIFRIKIPVAKDTESRRRNDPEKFFFEPTGYKRDGLNIYAGLRFNF